MSSLPWLLLLWPTLSVSQAVAQVPEPAPVPVVVRAELSDGTPMPGVPILRQQGPARDGVNPHDGWLRHLDPSLRVPERSLAGRTDPEGNLTMLAPDGVLGETGLVAGAPYRAQSLAKQGDVWVLRVIRFEQFVVKAIDGDDKPLVGLPLTLQRDGVVESAAVTDASGVATFGVDPKTSARLVVVPHGWIGPTDWFPTVAKQLPDKQLRFVVPAFGHVRVRAMVDGAPKAVPIESAGLHEPRTVYWSPHPAGPREHRGVEFGPVAVGLAVQGSVRFASGRVAFAAPAPSRHGEIVVVDVDADPSRPQFALQVAAPGIGKQKGEGGQTAGVRVAVAIHTDSGEHRTNTGMDDDGRVLVAFERDVVLGGRLRRVDVDVEERTARVTPAGVQEAMRSWSASQPFDRALANGVMELGKLEVTANAGLLRGRVVDDRGEPVRGAKIEITDAARSGAPLTTASVEDGRFQLSGPLLRDKDGAPVLLVATASLGQGRDAVSSEPTAPVAAGGEVTLVLRGSPRGFVELTPHLPVALPTHALQFLFVESNGRTREVGLGRVAWSAGVCRLGPLPPGRGTLRIVLRPGVLLHTIADLDVPVGVCRDPRLAALDLSGVVTMCRMRVVDAEGVPIAGARAEYGGASDSWSLGPSDGAGMLDVVKAQPKSLRVLVSAPGKQPLEVGEVVDGADIRLREATKK